MIRGLIDYLFRQNQNYFTATGVCQQFGGDLDEIKAMLLSLTVGEFPLLVGYTLTPFGLQATAENSYVVFSLVSLNAEPQ